MNHFIVICEFKQELQSGNAQFGSKLIFSSCVTLKFNRCLFKKKTRGLSAYTARSSFKVFSIATNACMWMLAKQGERRIKKVIKCIHFMQFAQHIYLLFWAKDHFHLSRRPDSLISYSRLCVVTKCTQQNIPYQRNYLITYSLFDHTWAVFISHYAWHLLMLVIICTKYRKL